MPDNQYKKFVNQRFFACIAMLKSRNQVNSDREFALSIGISPSNLGDIKADRRSVTIEILNRATDTFGINSAYIITGAGHPFVKPVDGAVVQMPVKTREVVVVATQDTTGNTTVPLINHKAAATFVAGYQSQEWFEEQDSILLPSYMIKEGQCYALQVSGDSMEPTLMPDDWVICRLLDSAEYRYLSDGAVYVVVSQQKGIQVKRVRNRLHQYGVLRCLSDNPKHETFDIPEEELLQVWKVEWHLRSHLPEVSPDIDHLQDNLQTMMEEMKKLRANYKGEILPN